MTRNLIIQFQKDGIDESPKLQELLQANGATAPQLAYRVLAGDHTRPLLQTVRRPPSTLLLPLEATDPQKTCGLDSATLHMCSLDCAD